MALSLRCLQSAKTLWSVVTPYTRRTVSGQPVEKFKKVYGSSKGVSVDNLFEVI